jgi:ribosomal protein S18 acetylase RimI-like enzyme
LEQISAVCFEGVSVDHNIERLCGHIAGKDWAWRKKLQIEDDINNYPDGIFVAEINGTLVGFVTTRVDRRKGIGSIPDLAVLPDQRRKGLAKKLVDEAIAHLQGEGMAYVRIDTLQQNAVCQHFYPKRGFKEVARVIHYIMEIEDT